jgi:hypothetical protein
MAAALLHAASAPWAPALRRVTGGGDHHHSFDAGHHHTGLRPAHAKACDTLRRFSEAEAARINRVAAAEWRTGPGGPKLAWYTPLGEHLRNEERVAILDERERARAAARREITARFPAMDGFYATLDLVDEPAHAGDVDKYGVSYAPSACQARALGQPQQQPQQPQPGFAPPPPPAPMAPPAPVAPPAPAGPESELMAEVWDTAERELRILNGEEEERPAKKPRQ